MISAFPKTLSSFSFLPATLNPHHKKPNPNFLHTLTKNPLSTNAICESHLETERGIQFDVGDTFFRHESATGRDLGVLSAALYRKSNGNLRVLDAMCGCGIRSLRYLVEAEADFVMANDANDDCRRVIVSNLSRISRGSEEERRWVVTHSDANRVLTECYLKRDYFDLIDVDSFGSDSSFLRSAIGAVKLGGLLYITSTDGYSSGGHRPHHSLAAYGAYVRPMPYANELGLRMLIGGAFREASVLGYHVIPLFSYYSYHGPVFRVLLQLNRGKLPDSRHYSFIGYCTRCGHSQAFKWEKLGWIGCPCSTNDRGSIIVSGPLWTGPLHSESYLTGMLSLAEQWEWIDNDNGMGKDLEKLLKQMIDESEPRLPFGFIKLDEVASRAKVNSPPLQMMMSAMLEEGYVASRSHISPNAIKTDCPMADCIRIAKQLQTAQ